MLTKAFIPYNGYYSSPFCRWQGSMAIDNPIVLGANTARNWFLNKSLDPTILDYLYFGTTVPVKHTFYSHNWTAAMLVDNAKPLPALMVQQACTTSTTCIHLCALSIEAGTIFSKLLDKGKLTRFSEDESLQQYELLIEVLKNRSFIHYEISNFAREGYVSVHNSNYWKQKKYLVLSEFYT